MTLSFTVGQLVQLYSGLSQARGNTRNRKCGKISKCADTPKPESLKNILPALRSRLLLILNPHQLKTERFDGQVTKAREFLSGRNESNAFKKPGRMDCRIRVSSQRHIYFAFETAGNF